MKNKWMEQVKKYLNIKKLTEKDGGQESNKTTGKEECNFT
jgi:hypothetical protein